MNAILRSSFLFLFLLWVSPSFAQESFAKGDLVEALWHGGWFKAKIMEVMKENLYKVHFIGYWQNRNEVMGPDRLRKKIPERKYPNITELKKGDAIEVLEADHWKPAIFVEAVDKNVLVRYASGTGTQEKMVPYYKIWQVEAEYLKNTPAQVSESQKKE